MTTNNTTQHPVNAVRRLMAGVILGAAALLIGIGPAAAAHADTTVSAPDPSFHAPAHHPAFPRQNDQPSPGTPAHHHHQRHAR